VAPEGWRLALSLLLVGGITFLYVNSFRRIVRDPALPPKVRKQLHNVEAILPRTAGDLRLFLAISITAGLCEEFLFRGFWIGALSPVLRWWGAAAIGVPVFGLLHAYQGRKGVVRTALGGLVLTLVVALTRSLLPAMAIHAMIDVVSGLITWTAMQEPAQPVAVH
jgi:membrane protease YdiL (CAAX protease family)